MTGKIKDILSKFNFGNLSIPFLSIMVLPFFVLVFYTNPSTDDFNASENVVINGFVKSQYTLYQYWSGRFFSNITTSLNPLIHRSFLLYKITIFVLMVSFLAVLIFFIFDIFRNSLTSNNKYLIVLSVFFLYLCSMPSTAQGFYWFVSVMIYQLSLILILLFIIFYIRLTNSESLRQRNLYTFITAILSISIAGSNEIALVLILTSVFLLMIKSFYMRSKFKWSILIIFVLTIAASYFVISAPGNTARSELYSENHLFVKSIILSFKELSEILIHWIFLTPLIPVTLILTPVFFIIFSKPNINTKLFSGNPFITFAIYLIFLFISFFIFYWITGKPPYNRTLNFIYFIFLIGWFYNVIVITGFFKIKFNVELKSLPGIVYILAIIVISFLLIRKSNVRTAYADLLRGTASKYNTELIGRYNFIKESKSDTLVIDELVNIPRTIFVADITSDPKAMCNIFYSQYFGKNSITLKNK